MLFGLLARTKLGYLTYLVIFWTPGGVIFMYFWIWFLIIFICEVFILRLFCYTLLIDFSCVDSISIKWKRCFKFLWILVKRVLFFFLYFLLLATGLDCYCYIFVSLKLVYSVLLHIVYYKISLCLILPDSAYSVPLRLMCLCVQCVFALSGLSEWCAFTYIVLLRKICLCI